MPTNGSTFTRLRDVPSLTGASALLGDSEGGMFIEFSYFELSGPANAISINGGGFTNSTGIFTNSDSLKFRHRVNNIDQINDTAGAALSINTFYKIAWRYLVNDLAISLNLTNIKLNRGDGSFPFFGRIRQLVIFNQAPTNTQLAAISTP
jgi:hypothetical protein